MGGDPLRFTDPKGLLTQAVAICAMWPVGTAMCGVTAIAIGWGMWSSSRPNDANSSSSSTTGAATDPACKEEECDPPAGTMCSVFHTNSTPHTTRDMDGNNLGKLPDHVHIWRMNKSPKGCIWNRAEALNYTPIGAKPCSTYPSWVAQHGR